MIAAQSPPPALVVSYADLSIATPEGALELRARVAAAARQVCRLSRYRASFRRATPFRTCVAYTVTDALRRADRNRPAGLFVVQVRPPPSLTGAP